MPARNGKLTKKEAAFVSEYVKTWNATKAARESGYKYPHVSGYKLLQVQEVKEAIDDVIKKTRMTADQAVTRLTQQAEFDFSQFFIFEYVPVLENGQPKLDSAGNPMTRYEQTGVNWKAVEKYGYLVKKISYTRQGRPVIEFVDSQKALELIGRAHGLFTDNVNVSAQASVKAYVGLSPDEWDESQPPHTEQDLGKSNISLERPTPRTEQDTY